MAPIGGGPPVGSTGGAFTGPAQALEIIGDHVYAFSGAVAALNTEQTVFDFTSGNHYIVATLTMTGPFQMTAAAVTDGRVRGYQLDFNGQTVGLYKVDSQQEDMPTVVEAQILIAPFTAVVLTCIDNSEAVDYLGTANITGRIYRS